MEYAFLDEIGNGKSVIVSGNFLTADARMLEMIMMGAAMVLLAWGASVIFVHAFDLMLQNSGRAKRMRAAVARRAKLIPRFNARREVLVGQVDAANEKVKERNGVRVALKRKLNKIIAAKDMLVRQVGEPTNGLNCYSFVVANKYVLSYSTKGQKHPLLDESWKNGQLVEVWARSVLDARVAVVERFPATLGYFVDKASAPGAETETVARDE
ncbi:MAG: hypothetical protein WCF85_15170 [Rhodospirillaceae bacterium]